MCTYEKFPTVQVPYSMLAGYGAIAAELARALAGKQRALLVVDGYPGTRFDEIVAGLMEELFFARVLDAHEANRSDEEIEAMLARNITDDRVFGVLSCHNLIEFFDEKKIAVLRRRAVLAAASPLSGPAAFRRRAVLRTASPLSGPAALRRAVLAAASPFSGPAALRRAILRPRRAYIVHDTHIGPGRLRPLGPQAAAPAQQIGRAVHVADLGRNLHHARLRPLGIPHLAVRAQRRHARARAHNRAFRGFPAQDARQRGEYLVLPGHLVVRHPVPPCKNNRSRPFVGSCIDSIVSYHTRTYVRKCPPVSTSPA